MQDLPPTGSSRLLDELSPFVPDDLINSLFAYPRGPGRPRLFSAAQLFRANLLVLLTPVHSFNLLIELLKENRRWRHFCRFKNKHLLPDAKMLGEFRSSLDLIKLRRINHHLLHPLLATLDVARKTVALIDATDLPAATHGYKKMLPTIIQPALLPSAGEVSRKVRAGGLSVIKNTLFACGCTSILREFCSSP